MKLDIGQFLSVRKRWFNQGAISIGRLEISTIGTLESNAFVLEEDPAELIKIVEARIQTKRQPLVTTLQNPGSFQSISSLKAGAAQSSAVCRLCRHFSVEAFRSFLAELKSDVEKWQVSDKFDSVEKIKEIFSIPDQLSITGLQSASDSDKKSGLEISISNLTELSKINDSQLAKINPVPIGTGFLVGGRYLLTNHHVISSKEEAQQCIAQFNYIEDEQGHLHPSIDYELDPEMLFVSEQELDYTLVQLKSNRFAQPPGYYFGWLPLVEDRKTVCPGLPYLELNLHPDVHEELKLFLQTELKKLKNPGFMVEPDGLVKGEQADRGEKPIIVVLPSNVQKQPDAESGSSLKEVEAELNKLKEDLTKLENIQQPISSKPLDGDEGFIIHHSKGKRKQVSSYKVTKFGLYKQFLRYNTETDYGSSGSPVLNEKWELVALHHASLPPTTNNSEEQLIQQGVRICQIVDDLKRKSVSNSKLRSFIDDFVLTLEQLDFPPLPSALEFDGRSNCLDITQLSKGIVNDFVPFGIEAWVNPSLSGEDATIFSQVCQETWYKDFKEDSVFGHYILSLRITPEGHVVFSREPFWKVSSAAFPQNGLLYPLIDLGSSTDDKTKQKKHPLDILALQAIDQEAVQIDIETEQTNEKIKALQCILYCLGFFPENAYSDQSENYQETYIRQLTGLLDSNTKDAIKNFNTFFKERSTDAEAIHGESVLTIRSEAINFFKARGTFLGLGTKRRTSTTPEEYEDHRGLRVLELQHCLASLDWNNPFLADKLLYEAPKIAPNGRFTWPEEWKALKNWLKEPSTTAYAVKRLQRVYSQLDDGVFGSLTLAALEQAKTYEVRTREKLPLGEFSHIAVTLDEKEVKLYINGQLANRRYVGERKVGYIRKAVIGARIDQSILNNENSYTNYFKGAMSEVRQWKMALSPKDIAKRIYYRLNKEDRQNEKLVGYWQLEEGKLREVERSEEQNPEQATVKHQERVYCLSNYAVNGIYAAETQLLSRYQSGESNQQASLRNACSFPTIPLPFGLEANQEIRLKTGGGLEENIEGALGITVELWMKYKYGDGVILSGGVSEQTYYTLRWVNRKLQLKLSLDSANQSTIIETQEAIQNTQVWYHVAFSWGATTSEEEPKEVRLYLNGKLQDVTAIKAQVETFNYETAYRSVVTFPFPAKEFTTNHQTLRIVPKASNSSQVNTGEFQSLSCSIAELRIWQVARSHNEIKAYLNQRLNWKNEKRLIGYWRFDGQENFTNQSGYCEVSFEPQNGSKEIAWSIPHSKALKFTDIDNQHWVAEFVAGLGSIGLLSLFVENSATQFRPDEVMSRQEFAALLLNAFGGVPRSDRANVLLRFQDKTGMKCEYCSDIEYVWRLGFMSGVVDKKDDKSQVREIAFAPSDLVLRCQAFDSIFTALRKPATEDEAAICEKVLGNIDDILQLGNLDWILRKDIAAALQRGLIIGKTANSKKLDFQEKATRAEIAAMVYQALVFKNEVPKIDSNYIMKVVDV